jgi:hypothetical protein
MKIQGWRVYCHLQSGVPEEVTTIMMEDEKYA